MTRVCKLWTIQTFKGFKLAIVLSHKYLTLEIKERINIGNENKRKTLVTRICNALNYCYRIYSWAMKRDNQCTPDFIFHHFNLTRSLQSQSFDHKSLMFCLKIETLWCICNLLFKIDFFPLLVFQLLIESY